MIVSSSEAGPPAAPTRRDDRSPIARHRLGAQSVAAAADFQAVGRKSATQGPLRLPAKSGTWARHEGCLTASRRTDGLCRPKRGPRSDGREVRAAWAGGDRPPPDRPRAPRRGSSHLPGGDRQAAPSLRRARVSGLPRLRRSLWQASPCLVCAGCGHESILAFSCKTRLLCPTCAARHMVDGAAHFLDRVLPDFPCRQIVVRLPFEVRGLLAFRPPVACAAVRLIDDTVMAWQRRRVGGRVGGVSVLQRAGGSLNIHPHLHRLVADGAWHEQADGGLRFEATPTPHAGRGSSQSPPRQSATSGTPGSSSPSRPRRVRAAHLPRPEPPPPC
ncbi:MAG: transposase zinc-binding domain-containing protein [Deltaproteobacteria bacterium]